MVTYLVCLFVACRSRYQTDLLQPLPKQLTHDLEQLVQFRPLLASLYQLLLHVQHYLVDDTLRVSEFAANRPRPSDVTCVTVVFTTCKQLGTLHSINISCLLKNR